MIARSRLPLAGALAALAFAAALAPAGALADKQAVAMPIDVYSPETVTIDQGERLTFLNQDSDDRHDFTAQKTGSDGKPIFNTPVIDPGQQAFVDGSQYLTTGSYDFFCTVHAFMTGRLVVTANGTPVPRPPDIVAPKVTVVFPAAHLRALARTGKLAVKARVSEAARITLSATVRTGGRTVTFARGTASTSVPAQRSVSLRLTSAGRALARTRSRVTVTVAGQARDRAGNVGRRSASRTLLP